MASAGILRVAINAPLARLFDYLPPAGAVARPGCRVRVPFGSTSKVGMVIEVAGKSELPKSKLKRARELLDDTPLLGENDLSLVHFTSRYYHHPIGEVVAAALPALLRRGDPLTGVVRKLSISAAGRSFDAGGLRKKAPRQAELLCLLQDTDELSFGELDDQLANWRRVRNALLGKGLIEEFTVRDDTGPADIPGEVIPDRPPELNADQAAALRSIRATRGFHVALLDGVTGSGKTEVYLHLISDILANDRQALVLVPEIGLTPQLVLRLRRRLGIEPVLLHSALSDSERLAAWRAARSGAAKLVVGTRSAIFAPLDNPGIIIVDEEHDSSLKQQEGLRYSARDLAVVRGKRLGIPVVLGSATPSLESLQRCRENAYSRLVLPQRAGRAVPPLLRLVDLARQPADNGLSNMVVDAIRKNIANGSQALVFLNRRGFAPTLICTGCGKVAECRHCDARMTVHAADDKLKCHHCGAVRSIDTQCIDCGAQLRPLGQGTERLTETLRSLFPGETVTRIDSDSTRLKGTMSKALALANSGETRILVGTQMLAKGHHFPRLTLVVVINADQGLFSTDFRGGERLAQSLVQVSGRAGREREQGQVIIQTAFPTHPFWADIMHGGYEKFVQRELAERERALWPPFAHLALLRTAASKRRDAHDLLERMRDLAAARQSDGVRVLGPVSAPMERRAGRYRAQLLLQSRDRRRLHELTGHLRTALDDDAAARRMRWSIDIDPIELF